MSEYHEVPYECNWCGKFGHALGDKECPTEWLESLHSKLVCNECADLLEGKGKTLEIVRSIEGNLKNDTKAGDEKRAEMRSALGEQVDNLRQIMGALRVRKKTKPT